VRDLGLPSPYCRGRQLANGRWEIEANIRGSAIAPYTEDTIIMKEYPNWNIGADMAMQEALSRFCYQYHGNFPPNSSFRHFGRCDLNGHPSRTQGDRSHLPMCRLQHEDMECHLWDVKEMLRLETEKNVTSTVVMNHLQGELATLNQANHIMETALNTRDAEITKKDAQIAAMNVQLAAKDAQIAALQAQLNPPPSSDDEDDDDPDSDDDGDDGGDEGDANAEDDEEEDPEEDIIYVSSDDEDPQEDEPPSMDARPKKRRCQKSTDYIKRFKF
jgi:hypothetical protein